MPEGVFKKNGPQLTPEGALKKLSTVNHNKKCQEVP